MEDNASSADLASWLCFIMVLLSLMYIERVTVLPDRAMCMSLDVATKLTVLWFLTGLCFNIFVWTHLGWNASVGFLQGFFLEYMMSFDNLFVFHLVFSHYCTPEALVYQALHFGIAGAVLLRVLFLAIGSVSLSSGLYLFKFLFGAVLIYSGIRTAMDEDEAMDTAANPFVAWISGYFPVSDRYDMDGHFFLNEEAILSPEKEEASSRAASMQGLLSAAECRETADDVSMAAFSGLPRLESFEGSSLLVHPSQAETPARPGGDPSRNVAGRVHSVDAVRQPRVQQKASLLLLVVVTIWVVDLAFAVDSVASKLASVSNFFLNCTSSAFAMMSLRSMYFLMESLAKTLHMLKHGIAASLVLIGFKLLFSYWINLPESVCFILIILIMIASIVLSLMMPDLRCNECITGTIAEEDAVHEQECFERRTHPYAHGAESRGRGREAVLNSCAGEEHFAEASPLDCAE